MNGEKISIITVSLNAELYIEQTITSVLNQTYENREYIIIDGGSSDSTLDIIRKFEAKIDHWISEEDMGIADAMNKGLQCATGDYVLFLHADDYMLHANVLMQASEYFYSHCDIYMFQVLFEGQNRQRLSKNKALGWMTNFKMGSCHQGHLVKRTLFKKNGLFDSRFKICMDYDFVLRCYRNGATGMGVTLPISTMRTAGISSRRDWASLKNRFREEHMVHMKNCSGPFMRLLYQIYWFLYWPYAWMSKKI